MYVSKIGKLFVSILTLKVEVSLGAGCGFCCDGCKTFSLLLLMASFNFLAKSSICRLGGWLRVSPSETDLVDADAVASSVWGSGG